MLKKFNELSLKDKAYLIGGLSLLVIVISFGLAQSSNSNCQSCLYTTICSLDFGDFYLSSNRDHCW